MGYFCQGYNEAVEKITSFAHRAENQSKYQGRIANGRNQEGQHHFSFPWREATNQRGQHHFPFHGTKPMARFFFGSADETSDGAERLHSVECCL